MTAALPRAAFGNGQVWLRLPEARVIDRFRISPTYRGGPLPHGRGSVTAPCGSPACGPSQTPAAGRPARVFLLATMR